MANAFFSRRQKFAFQESDTQNPLSRMNSIPEPTHCNHATVGKITLAGCIACGRERMGEQVELYTMFLIAWALRGEQKILRLEPRPLDPHTRPCLLYRTSRAREPHAHPESSPCFAYQVTFLNNYSQAMIAKILLRLKIGSPVTHDTQPDSIKTSCTS